MNKFNKKFDQIPDRKENRVVKYGYPEALPMAKNLQYQVLGQGKLDDYSSGVEQQNLSYTDYKKAHTTNRLIDPRRAVQRQEYRSVNQLEQSRESTDFKMTDDESRRYHKYLQRKKRKEDSKEESK